MSRNALIILIVVAVVGLLPDCSLGADDIVQGYINSIPPETPAACAARHKKIAERRAGPIIICHRGASAFAPENTLEAYAAAMDYGADGCEIDLRRTADGVLVLSHDSWLDQTTDSFSTINESTYYQLLRLKMKTYGTAGAETRIPTFAALLVLARQRAMLLHLDIKEPGLEKDIAQMLDAADVWDSVVSINSYNADDILLNPKYKPLRYKGPGLFEDRSDMDPKAIDTILAKPGEMIIVDDPRVAAHALKRALYRPVRLPSDLRKNWPAPMLQSSSQCVPRNSEAELLTFLNVRPMEKMQLDGSAQYQSLRAERITARARAIHQLMLTGNKSPRLIKRLEELVVNPTLHRDWHYDGIDGAMAAAMLGRLGAVESAPLLVDTIKHTNLYFQRIADPADNEHPLSWYNPIQRYTFQALADMRCETSRKFFWEYVALDEAEANKLGVPRFEIAAESLLHYDLTVDEIKKLLLHSDSRVRGTAVQYCLDHPSKERNAALKAAASWALPLPRVKQ